MRQRQRLNIRMNQNVTVEMLIRLQSVISSRELCSVRVKVSLIKVIQKIQRTYLIDADKL